MASIFVQISAYQDYELAKTIKDCLSKSSGQNEIHFGVNLVYTTDDIEVPDVPHLKIQKSKAPLNLGVGEGRAIANAFYDGEDYYLQVDSHTRFVQDWDLVALESYNMYKAEGCNPVLTTYPARYWYDDGIEMLDTNLTVTGIDFRKDDPELFNKAKFYHQTSIDAQGSIFTKSVSGGSVFASGDIASITPNNKMFNWGEEMLYAIRLFTHGYDLMIPQKQYLFHLYYDVNKPQYNFRALSGADFPVEVAAIIEKSNAEMYRIITNNVIGPQELGTVRTLKDYEDYAGISLGQ